MKCFLKFRNNSRKQNLEETEYIFTDNPNDDSEDNNILLTSRRPDNFVEKVLQSGDTLQSLSLDFNCPVSIVYLNEHVFHYMSGTIEINK